MWRRLSVCSTDTPLHWCSMFHNVSCFMFHAIQIYLFGFEVRQFMLGLQASSLKYKLQFEVKGFSLKLRSEVYVTNLKLYIWIWKWKLRTGIDVLGRFNITDQMIRCQVVVRVWHVDNEFCLLETITKTQICVGDSLCNTKTQKSVCVQAWTQNLSKTTPQTITREILPTIQTPAHSDSPIGETPSNTATSSTAPARYFSKKLHRSVTVSRGSKKTEKTSSRKKKTVQKISGEKQRLITAMLGIVPLGISTDLENPSSQNLENESSFENESS